MSDTSNRFLRLNAVLDKTGLSRSTLYRKIDEGTFPKQITIGPRCVAWLESDIEDWMRRPMFYEASDHAGVYVSVRSRHTSSRQREQQGHSQAGTTRG